MTRWFIGHGQALAGALKKLGKSPLTSLFNILVLGIALSLPLALYLGLQNVQALAGGLDAAPSLSVFMEVNALDAQVARVRDKLEPHPAVDRVQWIPKDKALEGLKNRMGLEAETASLGYNPLPDSFVVYPAGTEPETVNSLQREISSLPGVAHVELDLLWVKRLEALLNLAERVILALALLLSAALVAVTFNTIRLHILTQREEIEISRLIGATKAFVRRPFLYSGFLFGLGGGLAAWAIVVLAGELLVQPFSVVLDLYSSSFRATSLPASDVLAVLLFSALLGWLGAWLSASRHLWRRL
jgi:cell division transport system permease protein